MTVPHAVAGVGLPAGATILESGVNYTAPGKPSGPVHIEPSQSGEADITQLRQQWAANPDRRDQIAKQINELAQHVVNGALKPAWYGPQTPPTAAEVADGAKPVGEDDLPIGSVAAFAPAAPAALQRLAEGFVAKSQIAPEAAKGAIDFATAAQLPTYAAKAVFDQIAAHAEQGYAFGEPLSLEEHLQFSDALVSILGGEQRAQVEIDLAAAFLASLPTGDRALELFESAGSIAYSPHLVHALAACARARGITTQQGN